MSNVQVKRFKSNKEALEAKEERIRIIDERVRVQEKFSDEIARFEEEEDWE